MDRKKEGGIRAGYWWKRWIGSRNRKVGGGGEERVTKIKRVKRGRDG